MGWYCLSPVLNAIIAQNLLPVLVKDIFSLLLSYLTLITKTFYPRRDNDDHQPQDRPSPLLVPVPFHLIGESIKNQLPVAQYGDLLKRRGACIAKDSVCVVCMNYMEAGDGVRELGNCSHVFHMECLDLWIGQGQVTCPLCRSKLSAIRREELEGGDAWRTERMIYLFGEDYVQGTR